jgi:hypothetical protein
MQSPPKHPLFKLNAAISGSKKMPRLLYDLHAYEKEKADALKLWHNKLQEILRQNLPPQLIL